MSSITSRARLGIAASLAAILPGSPAASTSGAPELSDVRFEGIVVDQQTGVPIAGASVTIPGTIVGNLTNDDGHYILYADRAVLEDSVVLRAEFIGYRAAEHTVATPGDGGRAVLNFQLATSQVEIQALVVSGAPGAWRDAAVAPTAVHGHRPPGDFDTESYERIVENPFVSPLRHPVSTLAADVDRASYSNVRRFLAHGELPPVDAVRIEELINYFTYDLPDPTGSAPFAITTEATATPWASERRLVRISLQGRRIPVAEMPPSNLVFLLDTSGSMQMPRKLELVKVAMRTLTQTLRPEDRVAIVTYAGSAGLVLPPTSGGSKETILAAIDRLEAGGSTAGGAGIRLAYDVAERAFFETGNNRVILATDGDFNVGASSDAAMERLIEERRESGVFLTVLGFGYGNLKDSKLEGLADNGNGNYAYVDDEREARKVLVDEMAGTLLTIARDVKLQVEWNPARVAGYRLIGYENRLLEEEDFEDDAKDAGEIGAGHSVTVLYDVELAPTRFADAVDVTAGGAPQADRDLRYVTRRVRPSAYDADELGWLSVRYKEPNGRRSRLLSRPVRDPDGEPGGAGRGASVDLRFAASVAAWGMLLRESEHAGDFTLEDVRHLASEALGGDAGELRAGFLELVERTVELLRSVEAKSARRARGQSNGLLWRSLRWTDVGRGTALAPRVPGRSCSSCRWPWADANGRRRAWTRTLPATAGERAPAALPPGREPAGTLPCPRARDACRKLRADWQGSGCPR